MPTPWTQLWTGALAVLALGGCAAGRPGGPFALATGSEERGRTQAAAPGSGAEAERHAGRVVLAEHTAGAAPAGGNVTPADTGQADFDRGDEERGVVQAAARIGRGKRGRDDALAPMIVSDAALSFEAFQARPAAMPLRPQAVTGARLHLYPGETATEQLIHARHELAQVTAERDDLDGRLGATQDELDQTRQMLAQASRDVRAARTELTQVRNQLEAWRDQMNRLQRELREAHEENLRAMEETLRMLRRQMGIEDDLDELEELEDEFPPLEEIPREGERGDEGGD